MSIFTIVFKQLRSRIKLSRVTCIARADIIPQINQSAIRVLTDLQSEIQDELGISEASKWLAVDFESWSIIKYIIQLLLSNEVELEKNQSMVIPIGPEGNILQLENRDNDMTSTKIERSSPIGLICMGERISLFNGEFKISR